VLKVAPVLGLLASFQEGAHTTTRTSSLSSNPPSSQQTLQQALRTLRGIRHRYEMQRTAHPDALCNLHVALGDSDMMWIGAAIEALGRPIAADATESGHLAWQRECVLRLRDVLSRPALG
jgi:hypothetical protein